MQHVLKYHPSYFEPLFNGLKTAELRKLDRDFEVNDYLLIQEWDLAHGLTGREMTVRITHITKYASEYGLKVGYGMFSFVRVSI